MDREKSYGIIKMCISVKVVKRKLFYDTMIHQRKIEVAGFLPPLTKLKTLVELTIIFYIQIHRILLP